MSETEYNVGVLTLVENEGDNEKTASKILAEMGVAPRPDIYDSAEEQLSDDGYRKYVFYNNSYYKIEYLSVDPDEDIFEATKNADGTISFVTKYYNGGCSFNEAIEEALKKL